MTDALELTNPEQAPKKPEPKTFLGYISSDAIKQKINQVVGGENGQRFITAIMSAVNSNPDLTTCEPASVLSAAMIGEALKLSPSPQLGQYYIVPYNDNRNDRKVATFQLGYKGYIQLAIRSGQYKKLNVIAIKKGELKKYDPLNEELEIELIEDDTIREAAETIGYYGMFEYLNGFRKTMYWSIAKMEKHALKYSPAYKKDKEKHWKNSFWSKDFDSQGLKTIIRQLISKWGVMSTEFQTAFEKDDFSTEADGIDIFKKEKQSEQIVNISEVLDGATVKDELPKVEAAPVSSQYKEDDQGRLLGENGKPI